MNKRKRDNLLGGLLAGGVIMTLAYMLSISFYQESLRTSRRMLLTQMNILARQTALSMEDMIHTYLIEVEWMAELPVVKNARDGESDESFFLDVRNTKPYLSTIFILDRKGVFQFIYPKGALKGSLGKNYSYRSYFKRTRETMRPVVSNLVFSGGKENQDVEDRFWSVILAAPIRNDQGRFDGVLGTDIKAKTLAKRFISPVSIGDRGFAWLMTDKGCYIHHPEPSKIGRKVPDFLTHEPMRWFEELVERKRGQTLYAIHPVRFGSRNLVFVVIQVPEACAHSLVRPLYNRLLLLMFGVMVAVVGGVLLHTWLMNRISFLEKKVGKLEILIDEEKKKKRVDEITSSDYFQNLLTKVNQIKGDNNLDKE